MRTSTTSPGWLAVLTWLVVAAALFVLDGWWSLGNLALLLVLGSTLASIWQTPSTSVIVSAIAVTGFNWFLVPPRYTLAIHFDQDLLLLATLLCTNSVTSVLTSRLRQHALLQTDQARHAERLHQLGSELQHAESVAEQVRRARELLENWTGLPVCIWLNEEPPAPDHPLQRAWQASRHEHGAIGPGTGRLESLDALLVPLHAGAQRIGTLALGPVTDPSTLSRWPSAELRELARLLAGELQRLQSSLQTRAVQEKLQAQQLRNTLLAAIAHDYRTPLATITGAASSLLDATDTGRVRQSARTILEEAEHLHRMTTNTLQVARLDALGTPPHASWESVEELCGVALAACRRRHVGRDLEADVPPGLPLVWCDPVLVVQLLDNLLENALLYSPPDTPVTLLARAPEGLVQIDVLDRGCGIPEERREGPFEAFRSVPPSAAGDAACFDAPRRGMGLGLALCQAVARVHHAQLAIEERPGGGTVVSLRFPLQPQPPVVPESPEPQGPE